MKTAKELQSEISELKQQLKEVKGSKTEVYTRIVGYYRPVQNWNNGKRAEYDDRVEFDGNQAVASCEVEVEEPVALVQDNATKSVQVEINDHGHVKKYKLFYNDHCPGCPPVKNYLKKITIPGEEINAGTSEGLEEARKNNITGTPTVLFFNASNEVVYKAHNLSQVERLIA